MANSIVQPYTGPLALDYTNLQGILKDAIPGATRGLRREKPGIEKVLVELNTNIPSNGETLGLGTDILTRIGTLTTQLTDVRAARIVVAKLLEVIEETEVVLEDEREGAIGLVVDAVRRTARRKDTTVVASFEETVRYHGQIGVRAAKTRQKNKDEAPEGHEAATDASTPAVDPKANEAQSKAPAVESKAPALDTNTATSP